MALVGRNHSVLNSPAQSIRSDPDTRRSTPDLLTLAGRMLTTLKRFPHGLALAAPQVGQPWKLVVTVTGDVWIDPLIQEWPDGEETQLEGCLSLPDRVFEVPRPKKAVITYYNLDDELQTRWVSGVECRLAFHEIDHLNGLLIAGRFPEVRNRR